jgi:hypothetical protein
VGEAYRELKFIVKVRVVENSVKSHVGKVYDTQKRTLGSTPKIDRVTRPSKPNVDVETVCAASGVALTVRRACSALAMAAVDASTRDVTTPDDAMITKVVGEGLKCKKITGCNPPQIYRKDAEHRHPCWCCFLSRWCSGDCAWLLVTAP